MRKVQLSSVYWGAYTKYQALLSTSKYVDSTTIIQNIRQKEGEL